MKVKKQKFKKNNGWDNKIRQSIYRAVHNRYQNKSKATIDKHLVNSKHLRQFLHSQDITDIMNMSGEQYLVFCQGITEDVKKGVKKIKTGQQIISSCNQVLIAVRGDKKRWQSPSKTVGKRSDIRKTKPKTLNKRNLQRALAELNRRGHDLDVLLIECIIKTGMRIKEACLQNYRDRLSEILKFGKLNITQGSKGGRAKHIDRWIDADNELTLIIKLLSRHQYKHGSIIPPNYKSHLFINAFRNRWNRVSKKYDAGPIKDLRAAYACERYQQLTGKTAPIARSKACRSRASKEDDVNARLIIAHELGHSRINITNTYIGSNHRA